MENKNVLKLSESLFLIFLNFISVGIRGFVLYKVWGWFVTPLGVPEISFVHAVGLLFVFTIILGFKPIEQRSFEEGLKFTIERTLFNVITLVFAFATYLVFM